MAWIKFAYGLVIAAFFSMVLVELGRASDASYTKLALMSVDIDVQEGFGFPYPFMVSRPTLRYVMPMREGC